MNNLLNQDFRQELLRTDVIPRKLNEVSQKYKDMLLEDLKNKVIKIETVEVCQCGSKNLEELTKIDRFGLPFGSLICKDCGLVITNPRISQESLPYYYNKYYHPLNYGKEHLENQTALFADGQGKKIFGILKDFLPKKEKITVLEIGAGTGNVLFEFKEEAKKENILVEELGTEYSQDCIDKCKENSINTIFGNIQTAVELNKKFDVIILSHVFEHFIDLNKELNDLKKLMTDATLLYIEVPGLMVNHKKHYYDFSFLGYLVHAHIYNFTMDSLNYILVSNGFGVVFSNNEIETIYKLSKRVDFKISNSYYKIINYLEFLFNSQNYFSSQNNEFQLTKRQIKKQDSMIEYRDKEILKLTEQVENINKKLEKYESMIENRDKDIQKLSEQVENRNKKLEKYESMIENRDKDIQKLSEQVENRNKKLEKQDSMIEYRDKEILKLTEQVENRNKKLEKYESMIENRDKDIQKLSEQVENRNKKLEKYESMIENRDKDIQKLSEKVENRNQTIEKQNNQLDKFHEMINERNIVKKYQLYDRIRKEYLSE